MPGASGLDLLATVAERHPDVRRLLITGWPEAVPRDLMTRLGIRALIPKPWDDGELKAILRKELSGS
jgi:DNA-binding NarL/FixJ family response regulator